jgi:hypothetical protein
MIDERAILDRRRLFAGLIVSAEEISGLDLAWKRR